MQTSNSGPRFAFFLLATTLITLSSAAQQQIFNVTVNVGTGNGTLTYQEVVTQVTCLVDAKLTRHFTRINDGSFVYHPTTSPQIPMPGAFTLISGSPGPLKSTCPSNGIIGHPLTLLQKNYQIYAYAQTTGLNSIAAAYVPGTFGYINPKYVVASVLYAPPGSKSTASYTNSTSVSNTTSLQSSFTSSTTVSSSTQVLSGVPTPTGVLAWLSGTSKTTSSTTEMQQSQNSSSVTATLATSSGLTIPGPASDYIGLDHDYDIIELWINPVLLFTVYTTSISGETKLGWWGYGSSALDPTAPIDIWSIPVGCLNGDFPTTSSACSPALNAFQRPWAVNEHWPAGQGPGLTQADLNTILSADPWGRCTPNDPIGSTACPTYSTGFVLPNFSLSDQTELPYTQPLPGGQPAPHSYSVSTTNAATQTSGGTVTHSQTFGYEDAQVGTGFLSGFSSTLSFSQTLTWSYTYSSSLTKSSTSTGTATITGPACAGNPCNPSYPPNAPTYGTAAAVNMFVDSRFGTFAFLPAAY
jgi:hypothetical protein